MGNEAEAELLEEAIEQLNTRLPVGWAASLRHEQIEGSEPDSLLDIEGPQSSRTSLLIEARGRMAPREITALLGTPLFKRVRARSNYPILVITRYLSPRSRELLASEDVNYLDLTGNLRMSLRYPVLYLETHGAQRDPDAEKRPTRGLGGVQVGNIARVLIDVSPPYGVTEVARKADVDPGYATRVFAMLDEEALIERGRRGRVEDVDWPHLLRQRAAALNLLAPHKTSYYISRSGTKKVLADTAKLARQDVALTGSFAAARIAPIAAPSLLVLYTVYSRTRDELADQLGLLATSEGADVALVRPENYGPYFNSPTSPTGVTVVAPSQAAIDCLSGNGRMPSEGNALIGWMEDNESDWRASSLDAVEWPAWTNK